MDTVQIEGKLTPHMEISFSETFIIEEFKL